MMNEEIFLKECHDFVDDTYKEFLQYRKTLLDMLDMLHEICKKNDLPYYLSGGTLLGIVRDGNAVPWDPDIDVIMPVKHIPKLIEALEREMPEGYYVNCNFNDPMCDYYQIRIGREGYPIDYFHLDVFYSTGAPSDEKAREKMHNDIKKLFRVKRFKAALLQKKYKEDTPLKAFAKKWYYRLMCSFRSAKAIDREFERLMYTYDYDSSDYIILMEENGSNYPKAVIEPTDTAERFGHPYNIPAQVEVYENTNYKNYKEILPIRCRFDEFYSWMCNYNELAKKQKRSVEYRNT